MAARDDHRSRVIATPSPGVYVTHTESARHFPRHSHGTFGIGVIEHGAQKSASGRGQVDARAGDLISTNPGEVHDGRPFGGPTRRWRMVYMEPHALYSAIASPGSDASGLELTRPVLHDAELAQALYRLFVCAEASSAPAGPQIHGLQGHHLAWEEAFANACGLLVRRHTTREIDTPELAARAALQPVRERLADDLLNPPSLAELALLAGLSRYQLLRHFARAYGAPPHAWLMQQRTERARSLVAKGMSLASAAAACGFADQSHMTRGFMRQFGFTPGAWRQATLQ